MLYKMNQNEKTQTYKVKCPCGYENIFFHLDWEFTSMICQKSIGIHEVLRQLGKYD